MKGLKRHLKLLFLFAKYSLMSQLEYRINFFSSVLVEMGYLLVKLTYVAVVYQAGVVINGLTPDHIIIFIGTYVLMTGLYMMFYPSFVMLPQAVRDGSLDMLITKPVSLQFMATFQRLDFGMPIPNCLGGLILIVVGWSRAGLPVTFAHVGGFALFVFSGIFLTYCLFLIPQILSFWLVSTRGLDELTAAVWDFNNMPMGIYSNWIQRLGTFVLPVFVITNFPGLCALDRLDPWSFLWGLAAPILFFFICRWVWSRAVRHYASASG